jgi:hypothetical protein
MLDFVIYYVINTLEHKFSQASHVQFPYSLDMFFNCTQPYLPSHFLKHNKLCEIKNHFSRFCPILTYKVKLSHVDRLAFSRFVVHIQLLWNKPHEHQFFLYGYNSNL